MKILVINGPNLNMLGIRELEIYGDKTYSDLEEYIENAADELNMDVTVYQTNHEGYIIDKIQMAYGVYDGIIINAGGYTHTSIAIMDALKAVCIPSIEVHLSDLSKRESYRQISYIREACIKTISGMGFEGYREALLYFSSVHPELNHIL